MDQYISKINVPNVLTEDEKYLCVGNVTLDECGNVLKNLKLNKSPGHDGLPSEFYICFWEDLKGLLMASYQDSFLSKELSISDRETVLTFIFKKGNNFELKIYRPVSLSNVDYKILPFALANRLHKIVHMIISPEQTVYVKKRFIGENIRMMEDIIEYTNRNQIPGLILFLDFIKSI